MLRSIFAGFFAIVLTLGLGISSVSAKTVEVKLGTDAGMLAFEPSSVTISTGDTVKFIEVTADEAEKARFEHEKMVLSAISGFVNADPWLDEKALYTENLISGFL